MNKTLAVFLAGIAFGALMWAWGARRPLLPPVPPSPAPAVVPERRPEDIETLRSLLRNEQERVYLLRREIADQDRRREKIESNLMEARKVSGAAPATVPNSRRDRLLSALRGEFHSEEELKALLKEQGEDAWAFPAWLSRDDIPALLELGASTQEAGWCPVNLLSSQLRLPGDRLTQGMVAFWLIEGIRKGGGCPSLLPRLNHAQLEDDAEKQRKALAAYRAWWAGGGVGDPLDGTGLSWH